MDFEAVGKLISDVGVPLGILIVFAWMLATGRLRTQQETERLTESLEYAERLRAEEHEARLRAEERTDEAIKVMEEHTELLREIERDILRQGGSRRAQRDGG